MQKIFISYSQKDQAVKDQLMAHLRILERQGRLDLWDDQKIIAGGDWYVSIREALQEAEAAVLLVSADFLSSDFILDEEVPILMEKRADEGLQVIPIIVRDCLWEKVDWLERMKVIDALDKDYDKHFKEVARTLSDLLEGGANKAPVNSRAFKNINPNLPVYIEIKKQNQQNTGSLHQGNLEQAHSFKVFKLGPASKPLLSSERTWSDLMAAFQTFQKDEISPFGERLQVELGQFLFKQTCGQLPEALQRQLASIDNIDLRLILEEEWMASLPWHLLAVNGIFLQAKGFTISLAGHIGRKEVRLPASPKILVVAPQPAQGPFPNIEEHLKKLEDNLSASNRDFVFGEHLVLAETWAAFVRQVQTFKPELVYFYGAVHSEGLVFEKENGDELEFVSLSEFSRVLRQVQSSLSLVYLNFYQSRAIDFLRVGKALSDFVPAVVCSRVEVSETIARAQAEALLEQLLLKAQSPRQAVPSLEINMDLMDLKAVNLRQVLPICYSQYQRWEATTPKVPDRLTRDPNWHLKIDRVTQYSQVMAQTRLMLREQKPKSLAFTWYGKEGQGVEIFHKRLLVELKEDLHHTFVFEVRPSWPVHLENYHDSFSDVLTTAFQVNSLEDIPACIRSKSQGAHGKQTLVYVRHEPLRSSRLINPESLKKYIEWWDLQFAPLFEKRQFALLSTSFIVNKPAVFSEFVKEEGVEYMDMKNTVFWLLKEMENVAKIDLLRFLRTHSIELPIDRRDKVLQEILERTGGKYELTIDELKKLLKKAWQVLENRTVDGNTKKKIFDYM